MFQEAIKHYLTAHHYDSIDLKSVLFDMDGVLFNSMPYHADAWYKVMAARGLNLSREEAYMHEGRTGSGTINIVCQRQWKRHATPEEIEEIYSEKTVEFNKNPPAERMPGAWEVLKKVKEAQLIPTVVTGSGQGSLLNKLEQNFPGMFRPELMVTAFDVKYGKPNPEPYLMALEKGGLKPNEAIVIENAPLGVAAGVGAGIFTIAVNTGPLAPEVLLGEGADILFPSMLSLCEAWEELVGTLHSFSSRKAD
ncbi:HAD-IA family hydrolase [uncultured Bacteroides sp.]|uniref:HAD-IA family hydrolase n=1 Tax=uncultured Bacteroides sp. TaxID=162156 RepID=UPI002AA7D893|nr:HAD-IA family hydrolase [uncultured Bacteroides sp.]